MGPKKKEEQIDLSTLPECKSLNAIILCRGKKARAAAILQKLQKEGDKFIGRLKKSEILDHAKEKNIYVDPSTLSDKQKKDAKFMESINTELTAEVVAKAVKSLISTISVKIRLEKKSNLDKQIEDKSGRKYDMMYAFEDLPESKDEFEELAKIGENIRFVLVIDPKVTWANAPELPEEDNEEEQEDEEVKEYKQLLKKEDKTQEDVDHDAQVDKRINQIKQFRSQSNPNSEFRNCTISVVEGEIDPYNEEQSTNELIKQFLENINKLNAELIEYEEWKKDKYKESLGEPVQIEHKAVQGKSILSLLDNIASNFDEDKQENGEALSDEEDIMDLINNFSVNNLTRPLSNSNLSSLDENREEQFIASNGCVGLNAQLLQDVRKYIKFPGINRYLMPEIPAKSQKLRNLLQSQYALFLNKNLDLNEFLRRLQILNFEEYIRQFDEERPYSFTDRIYQQHHNKQSLQRQLYKALEFHQYNTFTKYDQNTDKLYLMLVYKNNPRRVNKKLWESNWKVIPNYESWLKYFKNNENNLNNTQFFDIDYEKIGNIEENTRAFTLKNGTDGVVAINKECTASNIKQAFLYGLKRNFIFGVQSNKFFSENGNVRLYHLENTAARSYETVILLPKSTIRLVEGGNVIIEKDGKTRLVTPNGYTIIYQKDRSVILHPTGGITYNHNTYINQSGYGLKDGSLFTSPTLKRKIENGEIIKRDDNTIITNTLEDGVVKSKWIKFYEGTEYQIERNKIRIEKAGQPFITCLKSNITVVSDQLTIRITNRNGTYTTVIEFNDGTNLRINNENINIFEIDEHDEININIKSNQISSKFGNEQLNVGFNEAVYIKNGKKYDARQQEEKYGEDDVLPIDYIEPRLFVISNDNTGFELLNEKMYNSYIKAHESSIDKVYQKNGDKCVECHIAAKQQKSKGKFIKNDLLVNLDVFDNTKQKVDEPYYQYISLKTLLRYQPLTPQSINELQKIKSDIDAWRKQSVKEENQFGHKQPDDAGIKAKIAAKILTIKKRQEKEVRVKSQALKETAKNFHITAYEEVMKRIQKENREKQLRNQFNKKKNSVIQQYKKVYNNQEGRRNEKNQIEAVEEFMDHYFMTNEGSKALSEMPEWVFRPKEIKAPVELDPEIRNELNNTTNLNKEEEADDPRERYDTVEVNLNPKREKQIYIKPSVFTQREIDEERYAFDHEKKAYKYHEAKRKDFNVYGQQRKSKPEVPTLLRTQPISEINQKYLVTEAPLDKKVKISSMKNKLTSSASNMVQMRKQGPHTLLMKTLDKGNDINKLLEKRTMMVQADLNDKLQRDVLINPIQANFGVILERKTYQLKIEIKNEDVISQRITIKRPKSVHVKAQLNEMGPIAMGMTRKISVIIRASPQILGKFTDQFDIVTKHEIYHIPITAHIISENQSKNEGMLLSRGVMEVEQNAKKKSESFELPRIK